MGKLKWHIILALWLALCGMASAERLYVNESGWWREDGAFNASGTPIQAVVDTATAGDSIYVWNGSYTENVDVDKRLTLEGESADVVTVTAASIWDCVFEVTADYVNISGFKVTGATGSGIPGESGKAGVYLDNADYCNISDNAVSNNYCGIHLYDSSNNMLQSDNTSSNDIYNIWLESSSNNTLTNNIVLNNNNCGIRLYDSSNNMLQSNIASNNYCGIWLWSSSNNTLTNNTASDNSNEGIVLYDSSNNMLRSNTASSNDIRGIKLESSSGNTLINNTASSNNWRGIFVWYLSNNNTLQSNTASSNGLEGIWLGSSNNNILQSNTASSNGLDGIRLDSSSNNTLMNNTVLNNEGEGIDLYDADNNSITCNWLQNNRKRGFTSSWGSANNNISYNNVIANGKYNAMSGGWEWQFFNAQSYTVEAKHNYWGAGMSNNTIDVSICDDEEGWGEVVFYPFETDPVPCPLTPKPPAFTTADVCVALQIAVGSREHGSRWDVNGDGRVTSLDALMILQEVAGSTEPQPPT